MSAFGHDSLWITRRQHFFFLLLGSPSNVQATDKWWESRAILGIIIELGCIIVSTSRRTCSQRYRLSQLQQSSTSKSNQIEWKNWTCCCPCCAAAIKDIAMRFTATCNKLKHHKNQRQISGKFRPNSKEEMATCRQQKLRWGHKLDNASPTWASSSSASSSSPSPSSPLPIG